jgi:hypothetical protein
MALAMSLEDQAQAEIPNYTPTAEATPDVTPAVTPEAPAPETAITTPLPEQTVRGKVAAVADYEKALAEAQASVPVEAIPEAGVNPPQETTSQEVAHPEETEPGTPEGEQSPIEESSKKEFRPRLSSLDTRQQEAILLVKELKDKGKDISLSEAERRINAKYGIDDSDSPSTEQPDAPARTADQIDAEIKEKLDAADRAAEDLDVKTALTLQREAFDLREEKARVAAETNARVSQEEASFNRNVHASRQRAVDFYPVASQQDHAIHTKATEIWTAMEGTNNPMVHDSDAPFKVYQMAANELGIPPLSKAVPNKSATPATPKPQTVSQSAVRRTNPASPVAPAGARTTTTVPTNPIFGNIRNANDYAETVRKLGASV